MNHPNEAKGAIVVASPYDWLFAKGCLASLRWFMPHLPVALLLDGEVHTEAAEKTYGVTVIRRRDIPDPWLRENSFGWGLTKMAAVWHSPFSTFLHLDADTVVWGDLTSKLFKPDDDVVWPLPKPFAGDAKAYVDTWFFQPEGIESRWPQFSWRKHVADFACTGTYVMRRNILLLKRYKELCRERALQPRLFHFGEMGMLNLMVFEAVQTGNLKLRQCAFQVIFPDHPREQLQRRFAFDTLGRPVVKTGDEGVLHMPDKKPLMDSRECYSDPMTFFRLKYLADTEGINGDEARSRLRAEDAGYHRLRRDFLVRERNRKIMGLLKGHPGEWRRLFNKIKKA